jgi:hypothetical protein
MMWARSHRFDARALPLADRHYNRRKVGSPQFVPPGRCVVLLTPATDALWVTSWPFAEYVRHAWPGAWVNSLFRNESEDLASDLIRDAVAATLRAFGTPPARGLVTFINPRFVEPIRRRGKDVWGYSYRKAGFVDAYPPRTRGGLIALQLWPRAMPRPADPICVAPPAELTLFDNAA